jgi:autotransporter-associated beta strand protein
VATSGQTLTVSGQISGSSGLTKTGIGRLNLSTNNSYTGPTTVSAGILAINGSTGNGAVTVSSGATLEGSGTVGGATTIHSGAVHSPGNSPGLQTFGSGLTYSTGSTFVWELTANTSTGRGTSFDGVNVTGGTLTINSGVTNNLVFNASGSSVSWNNSFWDSNQTWLVFSNANPPSLASESAFQTLTLSADAGGLILTAVRQNASFSWRMSGSELYLDYAAVPEPSTYALLTLSAIALGAYQWRRRRRAN